MTPPAARPRQQLRTARPIYCACRQYRSETATCHYRRVAGCHAGWRPALDLAPPSRYS